MEKNVFLGLVRTNSGSRYASYFDGPEYEMYLINDSDSPITLKRKEHGGFTTEEDVVAMATPQDDEVDIVLEPHSFIPYESFAHYNIGGADQYSFTIEINGSLKRYLFYMSGNIGFMGNLIPCLNKFGQSIRPTKIEDV